MISVSYLFEFSQDRTKPVMLKEKATKYDSLARGNAKIPGGVPFNLRDWASKKAGQMKHLANYVSLRQRGDNDQARESLDHAKMYKQAERKLRPTFRTIPGYDQFASGVPA